MTTADLTELTVRLRAAGALAFVEGVRVTGLTGPGFDWSPLLTDRQLLLAQGIETEGARVAAVVQDLRLLATPASWSGQRGRVRIEDFLPRLLLANSPEIADSVARRVFGRLEDGENGELATTLSSLAINGFDNASTSAALHVHRNTLLYRTKQIERLTGLNLRKDGDRGLVWLAVMWAQGSPRHGGPLPSERCGRRLHQTPVTSSRARSGIRTDDNEQPYR
ncbi:PucR family transcriptional regulator [Streptomyces sp.]|uniref:PucR family transcriptional regulator n=1 Tax=Streptomyces sp. TaxID=1931 RepID=UPI002F3F2461